MRQSQNLQWSFQECTRDYDHQHLHFYLEATDKTRMLCCVILLVQAQKIEFGAAIITTKTLYTLVAQVEQQNYSNNATNVFSHAKSHH